MNFYWIADILEEEEAEEKIYKLIVKRKNIFKTYFKLSKYQK